jgi:hypothetical protein
MIQHTVKPGKSLFRPCPSFWPVLARGCKIKATLNKSCWWSAEDFNKLGGMTAAFSLNNHRSALIAWRPADVPYTFIATGYTNDKKGNFKFGMPRRVNSKHEAVQGIDFIVFHADEVLTCEIETHRTLVNTQVLYKIENERGESISYYHRFDAPWHSRYREVQPSIGGEARKEMRMEKSHEWILY